MPSALGIDEPQEVEVISENHLAAIVGREWRGRSWRLRSQGGGMWQFKIRTLFILTAVCAGVAWVFFAPPQWVGLLVLWLIHLVLPAACLAGIVYHRGSEQAFFVGLVPWVIAVAVFQWLWFMDDGWRLDWMDWLRVTEEPAEELIQLKMYLGIPLFMAAVSGLIAIAIRLWAVNLQQRQPRS